MADTAVAITAGTGTNIDTRTEATNGNHRQVVVIGDPSTNAGVAPVDATLGLAVQVMAATGVAQATTTSGTTGSIVMGAAQTSEQTAVTTGQISRLVTDIVGKLIVLPFANPENFTSGVTAAITDTTSTSVIASQGGSLRTYITSIAVTNSHATVGTFVKILDGSTIVWEAYAAAAGGGFIQNFPVPIKCTAATAVNAQAVTTGANFIVCVAGYKGI